jgi:hypothetical protein
MIIEPIEITCPTCKAEPGKACVDKNKAHCIFHQVSYSFHFERVFQARKQTEEEGKKNVSTI